MSALIETTEDCDRFLTSIGEENTPEPAVILAGDEDAPDGVKRPWILTEDEDGEWWAWSFQYEDESGPRHYSDVPLPWTVIHSPTTKGSD